MRLGAVLKGQKQKRAMTPCHRQPCRGILPLTPRVASGPGRCNRRKVVPPIFPAAALLAQGLRRLAFACAAIGVVVALAALLALYCL